ncbi:unnamed protein product [Caenorhabditis sp. 36 PRJEB53466]|nr:unnamed protein product [Caenorhabditis sp. 36 PRJEB53466]
MLLLLLLFYASPTVSSSDWLTPQEQIAASYTCDPECWFNETEINSTSIAHWPVNCSTVCGVISLTLSADLSIFDLTPYFKNLKVLKGALWITNTEYKSTSFLSSLEQIHCDPLGIYINLNKILEELVFGNLTNVTCDFYVYNNTVLDASQFCADHGTTANMYVYANMKNCEGCVSGRIDLDTVKNFKNCTSLLGGTTITDIFLWSGTDMSPLNNVQNISGSFELWNTDAPNLSFMKSLKSIQSNRYWKYDMDLHENYNLTRMEMSSLTVRFVNFISIGITSQFETLTSSKGTFLLNVQQVHPDFCFTTDEMDLFMRNNVQFQTIEAKYCQNETIEGVCDFGGMSILESNCVGILGKVAVNSGDEGYVEKLKTVKSIYGTLSIQNTTLTNLSFLANLQYIASLNDTSTGFQVTFNKQLQNSSLPSLRRVYSLSKYQISFQDNGAGLLNSSACLALMDSLITTNVLFDGQECDDVCTFDRSILSSETLKQWPRKCSTVCADLYIGHETDLTEAQLTSAFKNMKILVGSLVVTRTKYTSGRFLEGLESVECDDSVFMWILNSKMTELGLANLTSISCRVYLASNKAMTRLNVPNLKKLASPSPNYTRVDIDINTLSPDFCITIEEMTNFCQSKKLR